MEKSSSILSFGWWFGAIFLVISGLISGCVLLQICLKARQTEAWPSVPGVITKAEVGNWGARRYYPDVSYSYEVGGREYTGHRIRTSNFEYTARDDAAQAIQGLVSGQTVAVYFDPSEPAQSILRPGAGAEEYELLIIPAVISTIGLAMIRSLRRRGARRSGIGADVPIEHAPHDQRGTKAGKGDGRPVRVHRAIIDAWRDLVASRETLLIRAYSESIRARDPDDFDPATVAEARQRFDAINGTEATLDSARAAFESHFVLVRRVVAAWLVFWTTIVPAGILGWLLLLRIRHRIGFADVQSFAQFLILEILLFLFFAVIGLVIQSILYRPFIAVVNKLAASAGITDQALIADGSRNRTGGHLG